MMGEGGMGGGAIKLASAYVDVRAPTGQLGRDLATGRSMVQSSATGMAGAARTAEAATSRATKQIGAQWIAAGTKTEAAARRMKGPAIAAAAIGAAVGKLSIDFDKEMRNVNSIAQLPERGLKKLEAGVLRLSGPVAQAPKTLAAGLYDLVSSGFDAAQSMTVLKASARAATAGLTTTEVSTKAVAAVLNAYRLPAKKAKAASDTLFETVNRGVLTFESLAQNIGDVLPFASSLTVNLREVGASVATMTKEGISAPETMTRIKAVMVTMLKPGKDLSSTIKDLGFDSGEAMVKQLGFLGSMRALSKQVHGNKSALAALFPNIRALGGVLALTGINSRGAAADLRAFGHDSGSTAKVLAEQSKSISYQWRKLRSEAEALAIKVGGKMMPVLGDLMHMGVGLLGVFGHLPEPVQKLMIGAGLLTAALYPLLLIGGKMMTLWGGFLGLITRVELSLTGQAAASTRAAAANAELAASTMAAATAQKELLIANSSGVVTGSVPVGGGPVGKAPTWAKWANRAGTGAMIGLGGMAAGNAIGGGAGNFVSGASAGAGIGMMGGPLGALGGAMLGGTIANISTLVGEIKKARGPQEKLADSSKEVVAWFHKQRQAAAGVRAATSGLSQAQNRAHAASERVKQAEDHLSSVRRRFGPMSRQALHAEYELAQARRQNEVRSNQLANAERKHGTSLQQYKAVARSTVAEERHRIHLLQEQSSNLQDLFHKEQFAGASQARLAEVGRHGLKVTKELKDAQGRYGKTLKEAAEIGGQKFAKSLKNSDTQTLRFWNTIKVGEPLLNRLGKNPGPKRLAAAFDDMDRRVGRLMANQRRIAERSGTAYTNMGKAGTSALGELAGSTNAFAQAFGGPKVNFSVSGGGKGKGVGHHATGGKVTKPIAVMGEEAPRHHEWVVATNPAYRQRNLGYWAQAGSDLGVPGFAEGGRRGRGADATAGISLPHPHVVGQEPLAAVAQAPVDKAYQIATAYLRKKEAAANAASGGVGGYTGPPANMKQLGDNAWVDSHTLSATSYMDRLFGLSMSSGYRSPSHNAAIGGAPGSLHTHGSPSNPGATDSVGARMPEALAWAKSHIAGLQEAMIDNYAGLGDNLHLGFFARGGALEHFVKGGARGGGANAAARASAATDAARQVVTGKVTWFEGGSTAGGSDTSKPGLALNLSPGSDSGWNNSTTQGWMEQSRAGHPVYGATSIGGKSANLPITDLGPAGWTGNAIDVTAGGVRKLGFSTDNFPSGSTGKVVVSGGGAGKGKAEEKVPAVYHGARTAKISFGEIPKSLHGVNKEIGKRQSELHHYRGARARAEKENHPKIEHAIAANITALEARLKQLFRAKALLRRKAAQKKIHRKLARQLGQLTGFENQIDSRQRDYEEAFQTAEQLVGLEPQPPELPASATDKQREDAEKDYAARFEAYVNGQERPAYEKALALAGEWRNTIVTGEQKAGGMETGWESRVRTTEHEIDAINAYTKKVAQDIDKWRSDHPKKGPADYPDWLKKEIKKRHELRAQLPTLRFRERELRQVLGEGRGLYYPGRKEPVQPPHAPLPGSGSFEESLIGVQGVHWPDQHSIISPLPAGRVAGQFGGVIWDTQTAIAELDLKVAGAKAGLGGGGSDESGSDERSELLEQLLREANQRAAVGEAQGGALEGWDALRRGLKGGFAGMFAGGGNIPAGMFGIVGERGPEIAHGPVGITGAAKTAQILAGGGPKIDIIVNGDIVQAPGDHRPPVEVKVDDVLQATGTGRRHPSAFATRP